MAPLQKTINANGFVLLEGLLCLQVLFLLITGILVFLFVVLAQVWLQGETHEALLCLKKENPPAICEEALKEKTKNLLKLVQIERFAVLKNSERKTELMISWTIGPLNLKVHRSINWDQVLRKKALSL